MSNSFSEIYVQADGILVIYDVSTKLLQKKLVKKSQILDLTPFKGQAEIHIWIWAYQFDLPYYFSNKPDYGRNNIKDCFDEYFWVKEKKSCHIEDDLLEDVKNYWLEQKKQHYIDAKSIDTYMQDDIYITEGLMSRVIKIENQEGYIQHYVPNLTQPFKVSKLTDNPLKQHQNFIFYTKMRKIFQTKKDTHTLYFHSYQHSFLFGEEKIIDIQTQQEWILEQLGVTYESLEEQNLYLCFEKMPDCQYYYKRDRWFGLEKCHTTTAHYQVKNGAVICISYDVDVS